MQINPVALHTTCHSTFMFLTRRQLKCSTDIDCGWELLSNK